MLFSDIRASLVSANLLVPADTLKKDSEIMFFALVEKIFLCAKYILASLLLQNIKFQIFFKIERCK